MMIFKRILGFFRGKSKPSFPAVLLGAIAGKDFKKLLLSLREWIVANGSADQKSLLFDFARKNGWSDSEILKLDIYCDFFGGDLKSAFEKARPFCKNEACDLDLYILSLMIFFQNDQFDDAYVYLSMISSQDEALSVRLDYWLTKQLICWSLGKVAETQLAVEKMNEIDPDNILVLENSLLFYIEVGDDLNVKKVLDRLEGREAELGYNYAVGCLALGEYKRGFLQFEKRYLMGEAHRYINSALFSYERWNGQSLVGKTLLVSAEQGLGDTIQMVRYLPMLKANTGASIVMETQHESLSLLEYNFPDVKFYVREVAQLPPVSFDYWIGAFSFPAIFKTEFENVPCRDGYIGVPEGYQKYWSERLNVVPRRTKPKIGLAWSGQPKHRADRRRSVPFDRLRNFLGNIEADFYSLQTTLPVEAKNFVFSFADEMLTLADTAALCMEMDLIITVDTSVAHIAGALGKETWLMLPHCYEWRWGLKGFENPWYNSIKVFRQQSVGDWQGVLGEIFEVELKDYLKNWRSM